MPGRFILVESPEGNYIYRRLHGLFQRTLSMSDRSNWETVRIVDLPLEVFSVLFDAATDVIDLPMTTIYHSVGKWRDLPLELAEQYRKAFDESSNHTFCNKDVERMWFSIPDAFVCKVSLRNVETKDSFNGLLANLSAEDLQVGEGCICIVTDDQQRTYSYSPNLREITCKHISL